VTLTLAGATVVTSLDPVHVVRVDLRVEDGRVAAVGGSALPGAERRDCSGCLDPIRVARSNANV